MAALTKPRPVLDTRQPATKPGTWGSQPPHMRLTDVENFARRLPTRATRLTTPETTAPRGTFSAAHLTDVPPYEERSGDLDLALTVPNLIACTWLEGSPTVQRWAQSSMRRATIVASA